MEERRRGSGRNVDTGSMPVDPLHFGCAHALRSRLKWCRGSGCARAGPSARAARHRARRGARARAQPKWFSTCPFSTARQCSPLVRGRSSVRFGQRAPNNSRRIRLVGPGHCPFKAATRDRSPHATPDTRSHRRAHASMAETGRKIGRTPELVTGNNNAFIAQW